MLVLLPFFRSPFRTSFRLTVLSSCPRVVASHFRVLLNQRRGQPCRMLVTDGKDRMTSNNSTHDIRQSDKDKNRLELNKMENVLEQILNQQDASTSGPVTPAQKVAQKTMDLFWILVIAAAGTATAMMLWNVISDVVLDNGQRAFNDSLKMIQADERCIEVFGGRIHGFGDESSRRRRRHIRKIEYVDQATGTKRIRILYYVKGDKAKGAVNAEIVAKEDGSWDYRYLLVETDQGGNRPIILIDQR